MTEQKTISEGTNINLKISHLFAFLGGLTIVLVSVIGFFYGLLSTSIDKKVEKGIYSVEKKYLDEKDKDFNKKIDIISTEVKATNKTLQTVGYDVAEIKKKQNNGNHLRIVETNSNPSDNAPENPNFQLE